MIFPSRVIDVRVEVVVNRSEVIVVQCIDMFNFPFICSSSTVVDGQMIIGTTDGAWAREIHR
jgi:hypothetical protein